ncbi:bifunctional DNA primase/polymerase [Kribbella italica]|uniref:DNA primase/polymerase bifunctional N-terminal domain-containing protein n=1 Tax=Kribbella italica TaxID=1540520 RepID=A0A7W9JDK7_9ACTN|nr:hypothetical protein [Kribbella italica]
MSVHTRRRRPVTDAGHQALSRAAHQLADQGFKVFPLVPGRKVPAVEDWEAAATTDHLTIARTWQQAPWNIGVATGPSVLLVVDLDLPKTADDKAPAAWATRGAATGADVLALIATDHHTTLPATHEVATASGGRHLYFTQPHDQQLPNSAGRIGWKIDTRGHGGYVVGAGSVIGQRHYTTSCNLPPRPLPGWITQLLTTPERATAATRPAPAQRHTDAYALAALTGELDKLLAATEGRRNHALNAAAFALGQLVAAGLLDESTTRKELAAAATRIGLPQAEADRTIASGLTAGARHPRIRP